MTQIWFVIDRDGQTRSLDRTKMDFWQKLDNADDGPWPDFTQLVVRATVANVTKALTTVAMTEGLSCLDVTDTPEAWEGALHIAQNGPSLCLSEVGLDLGDRVMQPDFAEKIAGMLACDAILFGHDTSVGLVHLTRYDLGAPDFMWCDSTRPGPSFARTFHHNGTCTDEDPRTFALEKLEMPATSPLLDRYAFVERMLAPYALEHGVKPDLDDLQVVRAFQMGN